MKHETQADRISEPSSGRLNGLDAARGVAVILMIEQHLGVWLWKGPDKGQSFASYGYMTVLSGFGGLAAPLFLLLLGIGTILLMERSRPSLGLSAQQSELSSNGPRPNRRKQVKKILLQRGMALLLLGYSLSLLTSSWFSLRSWFILHLMGVCLMLAPWLYSWSIRRLLGLAIAILFLGAGLQWFFSTPTSLDNTYMAARSVEQAASTLLGDVGWMVRLAVAEGQFPIFPWSAIFVIGLVAGKWIQAGHGVRLALAGLLFGLITGIGALLHLLIPTSDSSLGARLLSLHVPFFPASPIIVLGLAAASLVTVYGLLKWTQLLGLGPQHGLVCLGRSSLTILFVHVWMWREGSQRLGVWQSFSASLVLLCIVGLIGLAIVCTRRWSRVGYRYGAEWLLRKFGTPRSADS